MKDLNLETAKNLKGATILHHKVLKNKDKTPLRARVNGRPKTWKTDPSRVRVPMKHGLKECFYITEKDIGDWEVEDRYHVEMGFILDGEEFL
jgi:hypothetical protein